MSKRETNFIGNSTTIIKYILVMLATKTITVATAHGIQLPVDAQILAEIFGWTLGFIIATIDAKYPNNIFNTILEFGIITTDENENNITFADTGKYPEDNIENQLIKDSGDGDDL